MSQFPTRQTPPRQIPDDVIPDAAAPEDAGGDPGDETSQADPVSERLNALEANAAVLQLMADPQIAAVINARRAGQQVAVTPVEATPSPDDGADPVDEVLDGVPADDPSRELLKRVSALVGRIMTTKLDPLVERVAGVERTADDVRRSEVNKAITEAKSKYPDFDKYRQPMAVLARENPGLGINDLYVLARARAGTLRMPEAMAASEKPSQRPAQKPVQKKPDTGNPRGSTPAVGRKAWNEMVAGALEGLSLDPQE